MCFKRKKSETSCKYQYTYGSIDEKDYMEKRLIPQIEYYSKTSRHLQKEYYIISIASTVTMATVPVITIWPDTYGITRYIVAAISALASVLSSVLLIRRTKDNWIEYRVTSEMLQSELAVFKATAGEYQMQDHRPRFALFVERCERIMQSERSGWYLRMKPEPDQTYGVNGTSEETGS